MPFESLAQEGYMHEHPEILGKTALKEWDSATKGKHLPERKYMAKTQVHSFKKSGKGGGGLAKALVDPSEGHKPKGAHGRAAVRALGRTKTTGNFKRIEKAKGKGAAIAAYQNKLAAHKAGR